eukprot:CAMPEP_0172898578 /NCGR_PEP_ID=MMETSP1075-20121228/159990_1 /TAXON_ID=2916 /ORGANISM="Ceratium fusus, Strain PA161109" /LENGTH=62 /DNA_ID=CAMNT_0013754397 /DNA_START=477 /DNA_END=661 /DNA_ORIENTATION=-
MARNSFSAATCHSVLGGAFLTALTPVYLLMRTRGTPRVSLVMGPQRKSGRVPLPPVAGETAG